MVTFHADVNEQSSDQQEVQGEARNSASRTILLVSGVDREAIALPFPVSFTVFFFRVFFFHFFLFYFVFCKNIRSARLHCTHQENVPYRKTYFVYHFLERVLFTRGEIQYWSHFLINCFIQIVLVDKFK